MKNEHIAQQNSLCVQDALPETYLHLAQQLENEGKLIHLSYALTNIMQRLTIQCGQAGDFRDAEAHYLSAEDWKSTVKVRLISFLQYIKVSLNSLMIVSYFMVFRVQMYTANGLWEDAMRVAKLFGGVTGSKQVKEGSKITVSVSQEIHSCRFWENNTKWIIGEWYWLFTFVQVAYAWAVSLGGDAGAQLLVKLGLVEQAIEYAMEEGAFEQAFNLCRGSLKHKLPEVHNTLPLHHKIINSSTKMAMQSKYMETKFYFRFRRNVLNVGNGLYINGISAC